MIVDPDFFEHWRTRMLIDLLGGDEMAPLYLIRLWAHCQLRKSDTFDMPTHGLKAVCRYAGDADHFEKAMVESGWVSRTEGKITAEKWMERNKKLRQAWDNGAKGGRPQKNPTVTHGKPNGNPSVTQQEPTGNPTVTQREPNGNPRETDKIGGDKRGLDKTRLEQEEEGASPHTATAANVQWSPSNGFDVCQARREAWKSAYPGVDIDDQLRRAHAWYTDNPDRRKKSHARFLGSWMKRAHDDLARSPQVPDDVHPADRYNHRPGGAA